MELNSIHAIYIAELIDMALADKRTREEFIDRVGTFGFTQLRQARQEMAKAFAWKEESNQ